MKSKKKQWEIKQECLIIDWNKILRNLLLEDCYMQPCILDGFTMVRETVFASKAIVVSSVYFTTSREATRSNVPVPIHYVSDPRDGFYFIKRLLPEFQFQIYSTFIIICPSHKVRSRKCKSSLFAHLHNLPKCFPRSAKRKGIHRRRPLMFSFLGRSSTLRRLKS